MKPRWIDLILFLAFLLGASAYAQKPVPEEPRPVVVLRYDHRNIIGHHIATVLAAPVVELEFIENTENANIGVIAPLEKNSLMICHPFVADNEMRFRCGANVFAMKAENFVPEKE